MKPEWKRLPMQNLPLTALYVNKTEDKVRWVVEYEGEIIIDEIITDVDYLEYVMEQYVDELHVLDVWKLNDVKENMRII